ncbi:molybdenum cofactor biosynthesis protein [Salmonella enterica]|nr:molybdenum cofactor biosynthesis protein [Salmonella enterica]
MPVLLSFSWVYSAHATSPEQQFSESMTLMSHSAILSNSTPEPAPAPDKTQGHTTQAAASPLFSAIPLPSASKVSSPTQAPTSRSLPTLTMSQEDKTLSENAPDDTVMDSGRGAATRLWQILGSNDPAGQGRSAAAGIATGIASQRMEAWLNQYGHARVSLSLPGSGDLDLLIPVLDSPGYLLFTQGGIRRDAGDKRATTNLGLGIRGFTDNWMLGVNSFYDYDMTGENSRYGIGTEAWTDYLKLSANLYQRITDWHQSDIADMEDYDERPANGYDVRLAGWLPAYPVLGMSLMYEKYFGRNVALDDHTDLKDSPSAVTAGLNYTPIPLLTLGAEHRSGSGTNDSRVFLNINYRPGVSMADQTDPDMVGMVRTLAGSRYDMVERNNTIVMQYKKQELIALFLPATLTADAGSNVLLTAEVRAKYGLDRVDWDYSSIISAGGRVTQLSRETLQITLPPWQATKDSSNSYTISAVARDTHGNLSNSAETKLTVNKSRNDISSFVVVDNNAPANGSNRDSVRLTVVDTQTNQPVPGLAVTFSAKTGKLLPEKVVTDAKGMATSDITSVVAGTTDVTATLENGNTAAVTVTFIADSDTAGISDLTVTKDNAVADGKAVNAVQATVKDAQGNMVPGVPVAFSAGSGAVVKSVSVVTDAKGLASTTLTNLSTGTTVVTAVANNLSRSVNTTFTADAATAVVSKLSIDKDGSPADGKTANSASATVVDAQGHPVPGLAVTWSADKGTAKFVAGGVTDSNGLAKVNFTDTVVESVNITAGLVNGSSKTQSSHFVADPATARISRFDLTGGAKADGVATNTATVTVTDAGNNPLAGMAVNWIVDGSASISGTGALTDASGQMVITLTDIHAETVNVTATLASNGATQTKSTTFTADITTAVVSNLTIDKDGSPADGKTGNSATATVVDANGNPVTGATVAWMADKTTVKFAAGGVTNSAGKTTITFADTVAETANITASLNGSSQTKPSSFIADVTTATVSIVTIDKDGSVANGSAGNSAIATVVDANGNPVAGQTVKWTSDKGTVKFGASGTSGADGTVSVTFTDTVAETVNITATLNNGSYKTKSCMFVGDAGTAVISSLTIDKDGSAANGSAGNSATATVLDANGNPVTGASVAWTADKTTIRFAAGGVTDSAGKTTITFTDTVAETANITAGLNGSSQTKPSSFIADVTTATVSIVTIDKDGSVANGSAGNSATATVVDAKGNPVAGQTVEWRSDKVSVKFGASGTTGADGTVSVTFTDTVAETANITASLNGSSQSKPSSFIADVTTATVSSLTVDKDGSPADGKTGNSATATVLDAKGNPVAGQTVEWRSDKGTVIFATSGTTGADGTVSVIFTDEVAETANITASLNGSSQTKSSVFVADASTATVSSLTIDKDGSPADGSSANSASAMVVDAKGNPVAGQTVKWTSDKDTVEFGSSGTTGADGIVSVTFTDKVAETANIMASLNGSSQTKLTTFKADLASAVISLAVKNSAVSDGTQVEVTATVKDRNGNVVPDFALAWSATDAYSAISPANNVTDVNGVAKVNVSNTSFVDKAITVTASSGAKSGTAQAHFSGLSSVDVFFSTSSGSLNSSVIAGSPGELRIEFPSNVNYPPSVMSVTVQGESAAGTTVDDVSVLNGSSYRTYIRNAIKSGTLQATFKIGEFVQTSNILTVNPSSIDNTNSTFTLSPSSIPQGKASVAILTPVDKYGNPNAQIGNGAPSIALGIPSVQGMTAPATLTHMPDGTYQAEITTTTEIHEGTYTITAKGGTANMSTNLNITSDPTNGVGTIVIYSGLCHVGVPCRTIATVTNKVTGNPLVGIQVTFREVSATGAVISPTTVTTGGLGTNSSIYVTGTSEGTVNLVAEIAGSLETQPINSITISP